MPRASDNRGTCHADEVFDGQRWLSQAPGHGDLLRSTSDVQVCPYVPAVAGLRSRDTYGYLCTFACTWHYTWICTPTPAWYTPPTRRLASASAARHSSGARTALWSLSPRSSQETCCSRPGPTAPLTTPAMSSCTSAMARSSRPRRQARTCKSTRLTSAAWWSPPGLPTSPARNDRAPRSRSARCSTDEHVDARGDPDPRPDNGPANPGEHLGLLPLEGLPDGAHRRVGQGRREDRPARLAVPGHRGVHSCRHRARRRSARSHRRAHGSQPCHARTLRPSGGRCRRQQKFSKAASGRALPATMRQEWHSCTLRPRPHRFSRSGNPGCGTRRRLASFHAPSSESTFVSATPISLRSCAPARARGLGG